MAHVESPTYSVLIRTFNSERTLVRTVNSLLAQSIQPGQFVIVDSGSTDSTLSRLPRGVVVHRYVGERFNYSSALNQGLAHVQSKYTLVISSHTSLRHGDALQHAISLMESSRDIGAAYFGDDALGPLGHSIVDRRSFTGTNGVWNTCGIYRTDLLKQRPFRTEVFSAEDQEWSRWLIETAGMTIARIFGAGMTYENTKRHSIKKRLSEQISIARYTRPANLKFAYIARVAFRAMRLTTTGVDRIYNVALFFALLAYKASPAVLRQRMHTLLSP